MSSGVAIASFVLVVLFTVGAVFVALSLGLDLLGTIGAGLMAFIVGAKIVTGD